MLYKYCRRKLLECQVRKKVVGMQGSFLRDVLPLQVKARTEKQLKKDKAFPQRKFAIKA